MKLILLLVLCATAYAAPPPPAIPVVKRPAPLHAPSHAPTKDKPMTMRVASVGDPGYSTLPPMQASVVKVTNEFGTAEFTTRIMQPAGYSLFFEKASVVSPTAYQPLSYLEPQPVDQWSFISFYSYDNMAFVRATLTKVENSTMRQTGWMPASLVPAAGGNYYINPEFKAKGARAWSVKK